MKKPKILLVDDSLEWLKFHLQAFSQLFQDDSFEISTAMSAREGFNKAVSVENSFDLIITDLEMEDVFGDVYAGEWLLSNLISKKTLSARYLIISGSYNISDIANKFNVNFIPKNALINNPLLLKYAVEEELKTFKD